MTDTENRGNDEINQPQPRPINRTSNGQNPLFYVRNRLFHAMFFKIAITYSRIIPNTLRRIIEFITLLIAILAFSTLVYIHVTFLKTPATCLEKVKNSWPRDGVLRVEIMHKVNKTDIYNEMGKSIPDIFSKENQTKIRSHQKDSLLTEDIRNYNLEQFQNMKSKNMFQYSETENYYNKTLLNNINKKNRHFSKRQQIENVEFYESRYVVEYSLEYGYLRLSAKKRKKLNIPVRVVTLDPEKDACFGDSLSRYLLQEFLGYDDLLMASVRVIAEQEDNKGYLRNVFTGEHYRFVSMWWAAWSSYPCALCVMILFTVSISILLRYSHHQIFVFIVDLLQLLEFNIAARFPIAPLLTVILALVGMEAIMSEFFSDSSTAFYIILIVWLADQYDAICCHTLITKRHWLRFFYLYHFSFYAYHYRFNGQYSSLALLSSWFFIQHSMLYFFHHYELPAIVSQAEVQRIFLGRRQQNNNQPSNPGTSNETQNNLPLNGSSMLDVIRNFGREIFNFFRRFAYTFTRTGPIRVRVINISDLRRINLGSIQINPQNFDTNVTNQTTLNSTTENETDQSSNLIAGTSNSLERNLNESNQSQAQAENVDNGNELAKSNTCISEKQDENTDLILQQTERNKPENALYFQNQQQINIEDVASGSENLSLKELINEGNNLIAKNDNNLQSLPILSNDSSFNQKSELFQQDNAKEKVKNSKIDIEGAIFERKELCDNNKAEGISLSLSDGLHMEAKNYSQCSNITFNNKSRIDEKKD